MVEPKFIRVNRFKRTMKFPYECGFTIFGNKTDILYKTREELAKSLTIGDWIGSGCDTKECDTQFGFKSLSDVAKAKKIARQIVNKNNVNLGISTYKYTREEGLKLYHLKEEDVK